MVIFNQLNQQLNSLKNLLHFIDDASYQHPSRHLANASIGAHTRHIIELLQCAVNGYDADLIDYVNRKRNLELEVNRKLAIKTLDAISNYAKKDDKVLWLVAENADDMQVMTSYYREIAYNVEHTIHHLALIKVSLIEQDLDIVDDSFGMAYATIQYKQKLQTASCVQ